jgi:hypothetical protein
MDQSLTDQQQLRFLSKAHYVLGVIAGLMSCSFVFYIYIGIAMGNGLRDLSKGPPDPDFADPLQMMGVPQHAMVAAGAIGLLLGWALAVAIIYAGRCIKTHKYYLFTVLVSGICCLFVPIGTVLGIFGLNILMRPSVKALFTS